MIFTVVAVLAVIIFIVIRSSQSRGPRSSRSYDQSPEEVAVQQLESIQDQRFLLRPVMNKSEYRLFRNLSDYLQTHHPQYRVFPQVAMGAYLKHEDRAAYMAINSKRADFLIIDRRGLPVAVVELQGSGHSQGNYHQRDAIKRQAVTSAGAAFVELTEADDVHLVGEAILKQQLR